jgi:hypothetical protein
VILPQSLGDSWSVGGPQRGNERRYLDFLQELIGAFPRPPCPVRQTAHSFKTIGTDPRAAHLPVQLVPGLQRGFPSAPALLTDEDHVLRHTRTPPFTLGFFVKIARGTARSDSLAMSRPGSTRFLASLEDTTGGSRGVSDPYKMAFFWDTPTG